MFDQLALQTNSLAHAYIIEGEHTQVYSELTTFLRDSLGIESETNPNIFSQTYDQLTIADARAIKDILSKTAWGNSESRQVVIISMGSATREAQNALLKSIEEPSPRSLIFIIVSNHRFLLPTILSRAQLISGEGKQSEESLQAGRDFIAASYEARMKKAAEFFGDSKKDIPARRNDAYRFIVNLASVYHQEHKGEGEWTAVYQELLSCADYARDRSSSLKYIFEYIAIRLLVAKSA